MIVGISKAKLPFIDNKTINRLNTMLIILKRKLILQREEKSFVTEDELRSLLDNQIAIEEFLKNQK